MLKFLNAECCSSFPSCLRIYYERPDFLEFNYKSVNIPCLSNLQCKFSYRLFNVIYIENAVNIPSKIYIHENQRYCVVAYVNRIPDSKRVVKLACIAD